MNDEYTNDKIEIFGEDFDVPQETLDAYAQRMRETGLEMDRFFDSLPNWVSESDQFALWMMPDAERETWLAKNSPYFQKTTVTAKPITVGGLRI